MFEGKTGGQIGLVKGCAGSVVAAGQRKCISRVHYFCLSLLLACSSATIYYLLQNVRRRGPPLPFLLKLSVSRSVSVAETPQPLRAGQARKKHRRVRGRLACKPSLCVPASERWAHVRLCTPVRITNLADLLVERSACSRSLSISG